MIDLIVIAVYLTMGAVACGAMIMILTILVPMGGADDPFEYPFIEPVDHRPTLPDPSYDQIMAAQEAYEALSKPDRGVTGR